MSAKTNDRWPLGADDSISEYLDQPSVRVTAAPAAPGLFVAIYQLGRIVCWIGPLKGMQAFYSFCQWIAHAGRTQGGDEWELVQKEQ
jgi:hypothetical protein